MQRRPVDKLKLYAECPVDESRLNAECPMDESRLEKRPVDKSGLCPVDESRVDAPRPVDELGGKDACDWTRVDEQRRVGRLFQGLIARVDDPGALDDGLACPVG